MKSDTIEYYMAQNYPIEIREIPTDLGGGYSASIPCLGRWAYFAEADSVEEALEELSAVKRDLFEDMLSRGKKIPLAPPLPEYESDHYSGRLLLRIPRYLHKELAERADKEGCSLNQYLATALASWVGGAHVLDYISSLGLQAFNPSAKSFAHYDVSAPQEQRRSTLAGLRQIYKSEWPHDRASCG